jgi:adenylyltransferase/sulfurtransferase
LLDVREDWERALAAIMPSAHIPLGALESAPTGGLGDLDPAVPTVVYCAHGMRSLRGLRVLRERHGFQNVLSLRGGISAWAP